MKRKKQLLSWILSFLMVFSIMPMISISAFADVATYDLKEEVSVNLIVYPGDEITGLNSYSTVNRICYFNNTQDSYKSSDAIKDQDMNENNKILSAADAGITIPTGYILESYTVVFISSSGDEFKNMYLVPNLKEIKKITYNMDHITVLNDDIDVDGTISFINNQTYVTTGSSVTITIAADTGYTLPDAVKVEMGGNLLANPDYDYDQATGKVSIYSITEEVKITAVGVEEETPPTPPVTTSPAISIGQISSIGKTSATLKSSITPGEETIISQGFEWKKTEGGTYVQESGTLNNGILTASLTGLTKNTSYTIRPFVVTETDTYYGAENTFRTKKNTSSGSSSSSGSSGSDSKSDILIVEPTEEAIIKALKTSDYKKIQTNIDSNPNLLLSKAIIDALAANKDKTLIIVSNNVSTKMTINENNEMQFTRNGSLLAGFVSVCNAEYYLNYNGIAQKGWIQFPGETWYYLDKETGIKAKGWINDNGNWYYLNTSGIMQRGWLNDSGTWYYLSKSGAMLANTIIDGYVLGASGAWIG